MTALAWPAAADGDAPESDVEVSAVAEGRTALGLRDDDVQVFEGTLKPELTTELSPRWDLTGRGRVRLDLADELEPGRPNQRNRSPLSRRLLLGTVGEVELRELFVDGFVGPAFVRLGKQQIVWGRADGLKVLDVVNPQSFREFVLEDFDESRIPLWSANVEVPVGPGLLQLVWIPDNTFHDIPEPGAAFEFTAPRLVGPPPQRPVRQTIVDRPNNPITDSDVGFAYELFLGGWDLSLNYLFQHRNQPVERRFLAPDGRIDILRSFERAHVLGGSFANAFGDFTLRGEAAWVFDDFAPTRAGDGVAEAPALDYVIGLDWHGLRDTLISGQIFQNVFFDSSGPLFRDRVETNASLLVSRDFLNQRLTLQTLWLQSLDDGDGFISSEARYQLTGNVWLKAGADIFYGTSNGMFGQFNRSDRVLFGVEIGL